MVLVDSSVWISHLRAASSELQAMLADGLVLIHPLVVGEVACGSMKNRKRVLAYLNELPFAVSATHEEVMRLLDQHKLWSRGIGWIDAHLIASALLSDCRLWTQDAKLHDSALAAKARVR